VFGMSLDELSAGSKAGHKIPMIIQQCVAYLDTHNCTYCVCVLSHGGEQAWKQLR